MKVAERKTAEPTRLQHRMYEIIYGINTPAGMMFDILLIVLILLSILTTMLESVQNIRSRYGETLRLLEWAFTAVFAAEYCARLWCARRRTAYALSFFGIVDLLALLPTLIEFVLPGGRSLHMIRVLRVVRVFRILKLGTYLDEARQLANALVGARRKITVFIVAILCCVVILGSIMHLAEGPESGFTSIPQSIYWAIVTMTTVGFGDITPATPMGQAIAAVVMLLGYSIIAIPTGIFTVEFVRGNHDNAAVPRPRQSASHHRCPLCPELRHAPDALYCRRCGKKLNAE